MTALNQQEKQAFLSEMHVGVLSVPQDGRGPLTAPIWYCYTPGERLWIMIGRDSRKAALLEAGTRVSLCAQNEEPPYAYVTAEGPVESVRPGTDEDILELATRYLGEAEGKAYAETMPTGTSLTVTVRPETWLAVDYSRR